MAGKVTTGLAERQPTAWLIITSQYNLRAECTDQAQLEAHSFEYGTTLPNFVIIISLLVQ